jgi:hypothetical protein
VKSLPAQVYTPEIVAKLKDANMDDASPKPRSEMSISRKMQLEIEAAKILREQIASIEGDDPDFMRDMIEGETNIHELVARLVAEEGEDEAVIDGIDRFIDGIAARKDRLKNRIETRRALIASALTIAELKFIETPTGRATLSQVKPKAIILEEADIPTKFWKAGKPTLDKVAVKDALNTGEDVPGATLSNGSTSVTIRRN